MEFDKFRKGTLDQKIRDSIFIPMCWIKKGWLMLFVLGSSSLTKVVQLMFEHKIIYWFKWLKQEEWMGDTKDHNPHITWIKIFWQFWFKKLVCLQDLHILFLTRICFLCMLELLKISIFFVYQSCLQWMTMWMFMCLIMQFLWTNILIINFWSNYF